MHGPVRDQVVIATKFYLDGSHTRTELRRKIRARLEASLARLGTDHVELCHQHECTTPSLSRTSRPSWAN
ncbi:hypothetical protein GCM10010234_64790 [Streptomyces hawaiiensis]|uniref:aldo/keto reductase n=1 Tax=Streptomyces hawaiiensis TaxID=67305 RepID=UPI0031DE908D